MAEGSAVAIQAYLNLNGVVWKLMEDGSLVPLEPGEAVLPDVPLLEFPESSSPEADLGSSSSQSSLASFFTNISRDGASDIPASGYQTRGVADAGDSSRDAKQGPPPDLLPNDAAISIQIQDGGDGYVNRFEQDAVDLVGTTTDILDDTVVDVIVLDAQGGSVTFTAVVQDGRFSVPGADLSSLAEGPLTAVATYQDPYGNRVTGTDDSIKDTLASGVDVEAATGSDDVVNAVEAVDNTLSGTFADVQAGAEVEVTVSGAGHGDLVLTATLDASGNWSIPDVDLDVFDDGTLTLTASTVDQAGNPASITNTVDMDTQAAITAEFVDAVQPDGVGGYLNAAEGQMASFTGTVTEVEDGQTVTVVITDEGGSSLTFTTQVSGGVWQLDGEDLSSLAPGELTLDASVEDQAGNPATASDTIVYDPLAEIPAPIAADAGRIFNAAEVSAVDFSGTVTDVEPGRDMAITITDGSDVQVTGTTSVAADGSWALNDVDLSGLDEGLLTFSVTTTDIAGNTAVRDTFFYKDTLNELTAEFVDQQTPDGVGGYYNADEVSNLVTLRGTAQAIFDGLPVDVIVRDSAGNEISVPGVTISGGTWQADNVDLSSLLPGQITLIATSTDLSGNPAFAADTFIYDPTAIINDDITGPDLDDDTFNAVEIAAGSTLTGTVTDIEAGRVLDITIEDKMGGVVTDTVTVAADGSWTLTSEDLSGLAEGNLTVTLTGTDIAGNEAVQSDTFLKDTLANGVSIMADTGADPVLNNAEAPNTALSGSFEFVQAGAVVDITVSDGVNPDLTFQATLDASGNWSVPNVDLSGLNDGDLTLTAETVDQAGNPASITDTVLKDTQAAITAEFVDAVQPDGVGGYLNAAEGQSAGFTGTVTGVEDGQLVTVTVTDVDGNALVFSTNASGGSWAIDSEDLSSLVAGELTLEATVEDAAGNPASASDTIIYDPVAAIPPPITSDSGRILNAAEVGAVTFSGRVNDVEPGRDIEITITDNTGAAITETVQIDAAGDWTLTDVDVSGLAEGLLSFSVTTTDIAGNTAVRDTFFYKDTLNELTAEFVDQQTPGGVEGYYNAAEVANLVTLRGTANFIFDGETVSLSVRDSEGNEVTVPGVPISGGQWQADNVDLSSLVPGEIVLIANTTDDAGNPAFAADTFIYDPIADIPPPITSDGGRILNASEVGSVDFDGRVEDVEPGRDITITLTDSAGATLTETVQINADGTWSLTGVDVSGLAEGVLTFSVTTTDIAGNTAVRETLFFKDTINELTAEFVDQQTPDGVGGYYNADEVSNLVTLQGTAVSIADGEPVTVTVRDSEGNEVSVPGVTISGGQWQADDVDLSSLVPGVITLTAESVDLAGNPAFAADTFIYDPIAQINDDIDGPGLDDDTFNAVEIAAGSTLTGTVTDIESGRVLDIVIEDELGGTYTDTVTIAADGSWTLSDADLSALEDGTLTVTLTGTDIAGNDATRTDSFLKDTLATGISITADTGADAVLNNDESPDTVLSGSFEFVQAGALVDITVNDGVNPALTFQATLDASGNWTVPDVDLSGLNDGDLTLYAETVDQAGNPASITDTVLKDTSAEITALYDDPQQPEGITGYLNAVEGQSASFGGTVTGIEDGQTVAITITDINDDTLTFSATVTGGAWQVNGEDLSSLAQGDLTLTVVASDTAGNEASASDVIEYDPVAQLVADIAADAGASINAAEQDEVDFTGSVFDVESGRDVAISIEDGSGNTVTGTATIAADGTWLLADVDVSGLDEGTLTLTADTTDEAGNPATQTATFIKDTQAEITAEFVDEQVPDGVGGYYNATEFPTVTLQGTAPLVEDGQTVTVTVEDEFGNVVNVPGVTVSGETWSAPDVDLSTLQQGDITLTATVTDQAGNTATATDSFIYDPVAIINDDITSPAFSVPQPGDDTVNAAEVAAGVELSGTVTDIEPGRTLDVLIEDSLGGTFTDTVTIAADGSWTLAGADLSALEDGNLTVTLTGTDIAGNDATRTDSFLKDTLATGISITADTGADAVLNNAESPDTSLSGSFEFVQEGALVDITVSDGVNPDLTFQATLDASGNWTVPDVDLSGLNDGDLTLTADTVDQAGNPASITDTVLKDTSAEITALYDDPQQPENITGYLNAVEGQSASFGGTVTGIEDGQTVDITITDINDDTLTFSATVTGGAWQVSGANLSSLAQGALVLAVVAQDVAGNEATASDTIEYDPVAQLVADIASDAGNSINTAEQDDVDFTGSVFDVESGRDVAITISDSGGNSVEGTATIAADGSWLLADVDLSGLDDGSLTLQASTTDEAGNPATQTATFTKDTQAEITAEFVDEQVPDGVGGYYNATEFPTVTLQGTAPLVEDGQTVTVTVEDAFGNVVNVPGVTVSGELWSAPDVDLSSLQLGELTLTATVTDQAGNTATATDNFIYDPVASINADLASPALSDGVLNAAEVAAGVDLSGTVTGIEGGRVLDVEITDQSGNSVTTTVTVSGDQSLDGVNDWALDGVDLTPLADGELTMTLTGTDIAGNEASQTFTFDKDTEATITARFEDAQVFEGNTGILNDAEDDATVLSGTVSNVEVGDDVNLTVTDSLGTQLTFVTQVQGDGTWSTTEDLSSLAPGTLTLTADTVDNAGNPASATATIEHDPNAAITITSVDQGDVINADESLATVVNGTVTDVEPGRTVQVEVTDGVTTVTTTAQVQGDLSWSADPADLSGLADGPITINVSVFDNAGNEATNSYPATKDATAEITVMFEDDFINDGFGGYLNADEDDTTTVSGTVTDVEDGQTVDVVITDSAGTEVTGSAMVTGGGWSLDDLDLSAMEEGPLTVTASVTDQAGNPVSASDDIIHDTLASIDDTVQVSAGVVINAAEATSVTLSGTTAEIEQGRPLEVTLNDGTSTLTFNTTVASDGSWTLTNLDLSSLDDGTLTVTLNSDDRAGNPATASDTVDKDTLAQVTVEFLDDADTTLGPNGEIVYNAAGVSEVELQGTVTGVEDGQSVSIVLTDSAGNQITVPDATVSGGTWSAGPVDLTGFVDGGLTAQVNTEDLAGNPATASTQADIDLGVFIDIDTGPDGLPLTPFLLRAVDELTGTTDAEDGQIVTVTLSDGTITNTFTGTVSGGAWTVPVDASGLSLQTQWTLNAQVTDLAGNTTADSTPTLIEPEAVVLSETQLETGGIDQDSGDIRIEEADEVTFSATQDSLAAMTSESSAVTVVVAPDGLSLNVVRDSDGQTVMTLALNAAGDSVNATLLLPVDQRPALDKSLFQVAINATQNDADGTSETIAANIQLVVNDSSPFAEDDVAEVVEDTTAGGNLFDNDTGLEAPFTLDVITLDGVDYAVALNSPAVVNTDKGTLTVYQDGSWTLDAARNLDHQVVQELAFSYTGSDGDGDSSSADVLITIEDGAAGAVISDNGVITEAVITQPNQPATTVTIEAGSDDLVADSARFYNDAGQQESLLNDLGLTSLGQPLSYQVAADGSSITALAGGVVVFVATLDAVAQANGDLTIGLEMDLRRPLDHLNSDQLNLPFAIIATDTDGTDVAPGLFQLEIDDGQNPVLNESTSVALDEDSLDGQPSVSAQGTVDVTVGSDRIESLGFAATSSQPALSSGGEPLQYQLSADGQTLTAYTDDVNNPVFVATLLDPVAGEADSTIDYDFTLYQALDQLDSNGNRQDPLPVPLRLRTEDSDGDVVNLNLGIEISDADDPAAVIIDTLDVTELPAKNGETLTGTDSVDVDITASEDPVVEVAFQVGNGTNVMDVGGQPVTQNGVQLQWYVTNNQTLEARVNGQTVLRFTLPSDVDIAPGTTSSVPLDLEILGPVDHLDSDLMSLSIPVAAIDADGSLALADAAVDITDGHDPATLPGDPGQVDEDGLENGATSQGATTVDVEPGSDQVVDTSVTMTSVVTSGGLAVTLAASANANGWWVATTSAGDAVFQVRVETDGSASMQLLGPLDHPEGDNTRDSINVTFDVSVTDADNDVSGESALVFAVADDVPDGAVLERTITEGDDITGNLLADPNTVGADGGAITQVTYHGDDYFFVAEDPITIILTDATDNQYGVMTLHSDGNFTVDTDDVFNIGGEFDTDTMQAVVTDGDGDTANLDLTLNVRDADGTVVVQPVEGDEDTALPIDLRADPGDLDQGDAVARITFDEAALQGGTLMLDGQPLPVDGNGNPYLDQSSLVPDGSGAVIPDGVLTFTPALNSSLQTQNPQLDMTVDVSLSDGSTREFTESEPVTVHSVADAPLWDTPTSDVAIHEDDPATAVNISAELFDTDGSETLSYRLDSFDDDLILELNGNVLSAGATLSGADFANLTVRAEDGVAGNYQFGVTAISTEQENGDTAETAHTVNVAVTPVADPPNLRPTGTLNELEDAQIDVSRLVEASLNDVDGSESLQLRLDVPEGWSVIGQNGAVVSNPQTGRYLADMTDVEAGNVLLIPKEDISSVSVPGGLFQVNLTAVATETAQDGLDPDPETATSNTATVNIKLTGVVDDPLFTPDQDGAWTWNGDVDNSVLTGTLDEDSLLSLSFMLGSSDDDGSERSDLVIGNLNPNVDLVDVNGDPIALQVVGENGDGLIYQVSASQLANIYLRPQADFSGAEPAFTIRQVISEPDGDSESFSHEVMLDNLPVVDTPDGENIVSSGVEDEVVTLNLLPNLLDSDGSETLTELVITGQGSGQLMFDGETISVPPGGLDLGQLAAGEGLTLMELANSGRLTWLPPEDASGTFSVPVTYQITDTSETGETAVSDYTGNLQVDVAAEVDVDGEDLPDLTRLEGPDTVLTNDGSGLDLSGSVLFVEDDIDGSETLDYIVIRMPAADGWFVEHPDGAVHDGNGNWLIPAAGLTSDTVVENDLDLLAGVTIYSETATGVETILVQARALDGSDAEMISAEVDVEFTGGIAGTAQAVDPIQDSIIDGQEGETVDTSGHLNTGAAGDANDQVSFRVDAADLPPGASLAGTDIRVLHGSDGKTVVEYVFTQATLNDLTVVGIDEDIAGVISIPVTSVSTDPSGDTVTTQDSLDIELAPVVDEVNGIPGISGLEDVATALDVDLDALLADRSTDGAEGLESVQSITFLALPQGTFVDPEGLLTDNGDGTFTLSDPARISDIYFLPPQHLSGTFNVDLELTILDEVTGALTVVSNTDTQTVPGSIEIEIEPVTDPGTVTAADITGAEDSDIPLGDLQAELVDQDGSETLTVVLQGVPKDAVILVDGVPVANNGPDGGSLFGEPTFQWSLPQADLANAVIRPPANFSGDIPLTLEAVTIETGSNDVRTASQDFTVFVNPVGDGVEFNGADVIATGQEGDDVTIEVNAKTLEPDYITDGHPRDGNEGMVLTVQVADTSQVTALLGLQGIRVGERTVSFQQVGGVTVAIMTLSAAELADGHVLDSFELLSGPLAFGNLDLNIRIASTDQAVVNGETVNAVSPPQLQQVSVQLTALPDAPDVNLGFDNFYIEAGSGDVPLSIDMEALNPAPGEEATLIVEGVPDNIQLSAGSQVDGHWEVPADQVPGLTLVNPGSVSDFTLTVYGRSELNGETDEGGSQTLNVSVQAGGAAVITGTSDADWIAGGSGDDTLTGGDGADSFVFHQADLIGAGSDAFDTITDFSAADNDRLDLSDLLAGAPATTGAELDAVIDIQDSGGDVVFTISPDGQAVSQVITLNNTSETELFGGDVSGLSEAEILQQLLDNQVLIT